jgi:hypothetical protein
MKLRTQPKHKKRQPPKEKQRPNAMLQAIQKIVNNKKHKTLNTEPRDISISQPPEVPFDDFDDVWDAGTESEESSDELDAFGMDNIDFNMHEGIEHERRGPGPGCQLDSDVEFDALNDYWPFPGPNSVKFFLWYSQSNITDDTLRCLLLILAELNFKDLAVELGGTASVERIKALWDLLPVQQPEEIEVDKVTISRNRRTGKVRVFKKKVTLYYYSLVEHAQRFLRNPTLQQATNWGMDSVKPVREWCSTRMNREFHLWTKPLGFYVNNKHYRVGQYVRFIDSRISNANRAQGYGRIASIGYALCRHPLLSSLHPPHTGTTTCYRNQGC